MATVMPSPPHMRTCKNTSFPSSARKIIQPNTVGSSRQSLFICSISILSTTVTSCSAYHSCVFVVEIIVTYRAPLTKSEYFNMAIDGAPTPPWMWKPNLYWTRWTSSCVWLRSPTSCCPLESSPAFSCWSWMRTSSRLLYTNCFTNTRIKSFLAMLSGRVIIEEQLGITSGASTWNSMFPY